MLNFSGKSQRPKMKKINKYLFVFIKQKMEFLPSSNYWVGWGESSKAILTKSMNTLLALQQTLTTT